MFTRLLASAPVRQKSGAGLGASLALHGWLVIGAVMGTLSAHRAAAPAAAQRLIYVPPAQSRPRTVAAVPAARPLMTVNPVDLAVPIRLPTVTPLVDLVHALVGAPDPSPFVRAGGAGLGGIAAPLGSGGAWLVEQVDEPAAIEKDSPLPRFPAAMRSLGVEGVARFQFVVDTLGLVEMASVREMSSTREAFAMAVRGTLPRMRFVPARVGGTKVRQLVEFPIVFRIER